MVLNVCAAGFWVELAVRHPDKIRHAMSLDFLEVLMLPRIFRIVDCHLRWGGALWQRLVAWALWLP
jgi:hypothetical protein